MGRTVLQPTSRLLNHSEVFHAPGDRALARELFRATGPYLITFVDPKSTDLIDNVMYAPEVEPAGPVRPGEPGSVDPRVIQGFIRTDIVSSGFLLAGQQIELQASPRLT